MHNPFSATVCLQKASAAACFFISLLLLGSCTVTKQSAYLQTLAKDTTIASLVNPRLESKIQPGDQLSIIVNSLSGVEDLQFNNAAAVSTSAGLSGFPVYPDGTVLLHRLGRVTAAGLTRRELAARLQNELTAFMKEPIVNIGYLNHKITVIGSVGGPTVMPMPEEQLPIFDVLVKSGDISEQGMKDRVMIIRENGNNKTVKFVDLTDHAIFNSPWYYVQPNDIIVVKEDFTKIQKEEKRAKLQANIAFGSSLFALVFTIITLVTR
jgi:polysaccharide biosynthesis/export protein